MEKSKKLTPKEAFEILTTDNGIDYLIAKNVLRGKDSITKSEIDERLSKLNSARVLPLPELKIKNPEMHTKHKMSRTSRSRQIYCEDPYTETRDFVKDLKF